MNDLRITLVNMRSRFQYYAGENNQQLPDAIGLHIAMSAGLAPEEYRDWLDGDYINNKPAQWHEIADLLNSVVKLLEENYEKAEFLIHKECFHPDFYLWWNCPDSTCAELVLVIDKILEQLPPAPVGA